MSKKTLKKQKKEIEIISPNNVERDLTKPVSFRTDNVTYAKIIALKKARGESIGNVLQRSVDQSYEFLLLMKLNSKLYDQVNKIFGKIIKTNSHFLGGRSRGLLSEENKYSNPFKDNLNKEETTSLVFYEIDKKDYTLKGKKEVDFNLSSYLLELTYKVNDFIKIKFLKGDLIKGVIQNFNPKIYFKILEFISEAKFETETQNEKGKSRLDVYFELEYPLTSFEEILKAIKIKMKNLNRLCIKIQNYLKIHNNVEEKKKKI